MSEKFATVEGVRQGSVLSPILFISAMVSTIKKCQETIDNNRI